MATAEKTTKTETYEERLLKLLNDGDGEQALQLALAETDRLREERRADAEVECTGDGRFVCRTMAGLWRVATMYANSQMVPERFQGKGKVGDCAIAIQMARRLNCDEIAFMQGCYIVYGTPGIEAKVAISLLANSGFVASRIKYLIERDKAGNVVSCAASVIDKDSGDEVVGPPVTWETATAEKWNEDKKTKSGGVQKSKWNTMRELMFCYRAAMFLIRTHYPDAIMGLHSVEELRDVDPIDKNTEELRVTRTLADVARKFDGNGEGEAERKPEEKRQPLDPEWIAAQFLPMNTPTEVESKRQELLGMAGTDEEETEINESAKARAVTIDEELAEEVEG